MTQSWRHKPLYITDNDVGMMQGMQTPLLKGANDKNQSSEEFSPK